MTDRSVPTAPLRVTDWRRDAATTLGEIAGSHHVSAGTSDAAWEADLLLSHALGKPRSWLFAHADDALDDRTRREADALLTARRAGTPLAYLLGEQDFRSRTFSVDAHVLVPRDDTEVLVDAALTACRTIAPSRVPVTVVDAGTGSGIVAISLALECEFDCRVIGLDASLAALAVAARNAASLGARVRFVASDWLDGLADGSVDVIASNPPYIRADDPHLPALSREPREALVAGADGLAAIDRLIATGRRVLRPGGRLLLEHGHDQAGAVIERLERAGYANIATHRDEAGHQRVTGATRR